MAVDQGASIIIETHDINSQLIGHIDVVGCERVVGFNGFHVLNADTGFFKRHLNRRGNGHSHIPFFGPGESIGNHLYLNAGICAQFPGFFACGHGNGAVPIRRVGLCAEGMCAIWQDRFQGHKTFFGAGRNAFIIFNQNGFFPGKLDLDRKHVALFECLVVCRCVHVLLITSESHGIALLAGYSGFLRHIFRSLDHGALCPGISAEIVHHPVFGKDFAAGTIGVRPGGMGAVGATVRHKAVNILIQPGFDAGSRLKNTGGGGGAGLADQHARRTDGAD